MKRRGFLSILVLTVLALGSGVHSRAAGLGDDAIRDCYYQSYRYEKAQNFEDAIKAMAPVLAEYPQGYTVNLRLGWLHYLNGQHANAKAHYQTAMKVAPESIEARLGYTLPLLAQERYEDVESVTRQILRVDASNYYANLRLAFALRLEKKLEPAEEILERMSVLYPTDVKFLVERGLVKAAKNQTDAARRIFADVLTLDPENPVAREYLGAASKAAGTKPELGAKP
jgi:tetratricopeptide (TPR) repeat protein